MHRRINILVTVTALVLLVAGACGPPPSPEEQISELRSKYEAELNGFVVAQDPAEAAEGDEAEMAADEEAAGPAEEADAGEGEGAEAEMAEMTPVRQDVLLDVLVSTSSRETLPGITVDVTQADSEGDPKQTWRVYLDTSDVHRGPGTQISYRLEDVEYEEGDGFNVEIRHPVPPEERSEYQEFQELASEG